VLLTARQQLPHAAVPPGGSKTLGLLSAEEALDLFAQSYGRGVIQNLSAVEQESGRRIVAVLGQHTLAVKLAGAYAFDLSRPLGALLDELEADLLKLPDGETPRYVELMLRRSVDSLPEEAHRLFSALAAFVLPPSSDPTLQTAAEFGRAALLALARGLGLDDPEAPADLLVRRSLMDAYVHEELPEGTDRERRRLHPLAREFAVNEFAQWDEAEQERAYTILVEYYIAYTQMNTSNEDQLALAPDEGNIIRKIELAHTRGDGASLARLCVGIEHYCHLTWHTRAALPYFNVNSG
jgi:hypothetical protein